MPKKPAAKAKPKAKQIPPETVSATPPANAKTGITKEIALADPRFGFGYAGFYTQVKYNPDDLIARQGLRIYAQMRRDEQVKASLKTKKLATIASGGEVVIEDKARADEAQLDEMKRFIEFNLNEMAGTIESYMLNMLTALDFGYSITEPVYKLIDYGEFKGKYGWKALKVRRPDQIEFETDQFGNLTENGIRQGNKPLPSNRFAIYTYQKEHDNLYGESDLRAVYRCYSDDTEILTKSGWKLVSDLTKTDEFATLNPDTEVLEYNKPTRLYAYPYRGKMFNQTGRFIDLCVTPNHRMWVESRERGGFKFVEAKKLSRRVRYKRNANWAGREVESFILPAIQVSQVYRTGTGHVNETVYTRDVPERTISMDSWLRFLGVYLAEGHCGRYGENNQAIVGITQNEGKKFETIKQWATDCGFTFCIKTDKNSPKRCIEISNLQLETYLAPLGNSHDKFIPAEFKELSPRQLHILWEAMMLGDGHDTTYFSVSKRLIDDVAEIVLKMGKAPTIYSQTQLENKFGTNPIWKVNANSRSIGSTLVNSHSDNRKWIDYDGKVYCLEVPNHLVYVRRNGKSCWSGNSWFVKDTLVKFAAMCYERYGQPIPVVKTQQTLSDADMATVMQILNNIQARTGILIPGTVDLTFENPGPGAHAAFGPIFSQLDQWIAMGICVPSLIGAGGGKQDVGSNARSQTEQDTFIWVVEQLRNDVQEFFNDQIVKMLLDINYEVEDGIYPKWQFKELTRERRKEIADQFVSLLTGQAITKTREDEDYIRTVADLPDLPENVVPAGTREAQEQTLQDQMQMTEHQGKIDGAQPGQPEQTGDQIKAQMGYTRQYFDESQPRVPAGSSGGGQWTAGGGSGSSDKAGGKPDKEAIRKAVEKYIGGDEKALDAYPKVKARIDGEDDTAVADNNNSQKEENADLKSSGLLRVAGDWKSALNKQRLNSLQDYSGTLYKEINSGLRGGEKELIDKHKDVIAGVEGAIAAFKLPQDVTVYRGATMSTRELENIIDAREFTDHGFVSTSQSRSVIDKFIGDGGGSRETNVVFQIKLPKGFNAAPMEMIADHKEEREFLLPRGMKFRITSGESKGATRVLNLTPVQESIKRHAKEEIVKKKSPKSDEKFLWTMDHLEIDLAANPEQPGAAKPFDHQDYHLPGQHDQEDHGNRGGDLVDTALKSGGFTYNPIRMKGRRPPSDGFALSIAKNTEKVIALTRTRDEVKEQLKSYVRAHWNNIKAEGNFLGGWIDNGKLYLDISNVVKDKNEAIAKARKADQLAAFDLGKGETVELKKAA